MARPRKRIHFVRALIISVTVILAAFIAIRGYQSQILKGQADRFIKLGNPQEAILLYQEAFDLFPIRHDLISDLEAARLIWESDLDYGQIYQIGQLQAQPSENELPSYHNLRENEFFVPILMYHHIRENPRPDDTVWAILNVSPKQLDEQLEYLTTHNFHIITLSDLYEGIQGKTFLPEKPIVLTFDDGYRSFYDEVFPLLKKYKVPVTQFVITSVVDASPYLTWDEIKDMDASGFVEWGAHTRHHPSLPDLSQSSIVDEISGSKADLEEHLHKPVRWFAYPYGSYSSFILGEVEKEGYLGAVSTVYSPVQRKDTRFLMPRIMVDGRLSLDSFVKRIQ